MGESERNTELDAVETELIELEELIVLRRRKVELLGRKVELLRERSDVADLSQVSQDRASTSTPSTAPVVQVGLKRKQEEGEEPRRFKRAFGHFVEANRAEAEAVLASGEGWDG
mmetsp:Transcript_2707/g.6251  ORF Transcript_2707/g.6251 Transcript_2707/m.6251 type:complete len:114 (-) Transcript_2707:168-509(-)